MVAPEPGSAEQDREARAARNAGVAGLLLLFAAVVPLVRVTGTPGLGRALQEALPTPAAQRVAGLLLACTTAALLLTAVGRTERGMPPFRLLVPLCALGTLQVCLAPLGRAPTGGGASPSAVGLVPAMTTVLYLSHPVLLVAALLVLRRRRRRQAGPAAARGSRLGLAAWGRGLGVLLATPFVVALAVDLLT